MYNKNNIFSESKLKSNFFPKFIYFILGQKYLSKKHFTKHLKAPMSTLSKYRKTHIYQPSIIVMSLRSFINNLFILS